SPLPAPSPYTEQSAGLTERREFASRPVLPVCTARRVPRSRPPSVPGTHAMALRPSSVPLHLPLLAPPESSLPEVHDPESDRARAANLTVSRLLATAVNDPSFESAAVSSLVAELLDFAATCSLDYATALVAESASASPPFIGGECALCTDVLEDRQEDLECLAAAAEAIMVPYSSQWQAAMDAEMASWKSTGTYIDEVPPPEANIVDDMWIFRVKRPPGSLPSFKAHYVARGFSQRQGVDYFQTFSPTPKMTTLRVLLHVVAQRDYELHSVDFSTAFLQGSLHEEIWLRRPPGFTRLFPAGLHLRLHWRSTRSSSVLNSSCEADIYAGAMAAQELCWLTYLLTDSGEQPRSPPILYVDNKAMIALCQEHRLEHRTKHIALRYFLARELQQRGQLRLAYVATRANTANVFTKALPPGDHQCFSTVLGLYFISTPDVGLTYTANLTATLQLHGYVDADHAGDADNRRSRTCFVFQLQLAELISWNSQKQELIALSSAEAEFIAASAAVCEGPYLMKLLQEVKVTMNGHFTLLCNNQSEIKSRKSLAL
ncbi:unnamed protein product, partial [Closterium sp. NIES-53]